MCDRYGMLLVVDEVQSGMGRTGKLYAFEHWGVQPDILCLAKGIASGSHASTFGGNPVSCRAALATLDLLEAGYTANAAQRGEQLKQALARLQRKHPEIVGEVRGLGLMVAMDMVKEGAPAVHDPHLRDAVVDAAFRHGLLLLGCGESAVRFCPPLCVTAEQVETAVRVVDEVLTATAADRPKLAV